MARRAIQFCWHVLPTVLENFRSKETHCLASSEPGKEKKREKKKERKMKIRRQRTENNISHIYSHIQPFILMHPKKKSSLTCLTTSRTVICSCSINSAATSTPLRLMPAVQCTRQFLCLSVTAFHLLI